jgi:hypothetical protein
LQQSGHWLAWLAAAPNTATLAPSAVPLAGGVQSFPAPSYCLDHLHGDAWLAIGDAASAFDPVTSQGIVKALANGLAAAGAIAGHATLGAVAHTVALRHAQYLAQRQQYYGWEQRWPAAPFWRQLHAGAQVPASMPPEYPECIDVGQMVRALWPGGIPVGNAVCQQPLQQAILFMVIEIDDVRQPGQQTALSEQNAETDHAVDLPRPGFPCFQGRWRRTAAVPCAWPRKTVRSASASLSLARGRVSASRTHPDIN